MITNKQISDFLKKDGFNLTDYEYNSIRTLLIELAMTEYDYFRQNKLKTNLVKKYEINTIYNNDLIKNAA
jgi:hypothetical protein